MSTIFCIGNSIVESEGDEFGAGGWVGRLQHKILANTKVGENRVYNLGVGMETSLDLLHRLHSEVSYRNPDIIILQASHGDSRFHQSLDGKHDFEIGSAARLRTWSRILRFLKNFKSLVVGLNPICLDPSFKKAIPQRAEDFEEYNEFIRKECRRSRIPFLDAMVSTPTQKDTT